MKTNTTSSLGSEATFSEKKTLEKLASSTNERLAAWARMQLAPEAMEPLGQSLTSPLLRPRHLTAVAVAMAEQRDRADGRLFFFTQNLHIQGLRVDKALCFAAEAVCSLCWSSWKETDSARSWLSPAAEGHRALAFLIGEVDSHECSHVHGFLLVPPSISARPKELIERMRPVPEHVASIQGAMLQHGAIDLIAISRADSVGPFAAYAAKRWNGSDPDGPNINYAPYGSSVRVDWHGINQRSDAIIREQQIADQRAAYERASRTCELLKVGLEQLHAEAKKVSDVTPARAKRRARGRQRPLVTPVATKRVPVLPRLRAPTGFIEW